MCGNMKQKICACLFFLTGNVWWLPPLWLTYVSVSIVSQCVLLMRRLSVSINHFVFRIFMTESILFSTESCSFARVSQGSNLHKHDFLQFELRRAVEGSPSWDSLLLAECYTGLPSILQVTTWRFPLAMMEESLSFKLAASGSGSIPLATHSTLLLHTLKVKKASLIKCGGGSGDLTSKSKVTVIS